MMVKWRRPKLSMVSNRRPNLPVVKGGGGSWQW